MTPELIALALAGLLQAAQFALVSVKANLEVGPGKTASPRDRERLGGDLQDQLSTKTARLYRALNNHFEGLILFTMAVVVTEMSGQNSYLTMTCAFLYLGARVLYIPAYYFGWAPWRSAIWFVGFLATLTMLIAALL